MPSSATRCLVTGAGGAIGKAVVEGLVERGHEVVAVDAQPMTGLASSVASITARLGALATPAVTLDGPIHHSFLVAGGALSEEVEGPLLGLDRKALRRTIEDNLVSAIDGIEVARSGWSPSPETPLGSITLVSSVNGFGSFGLPVYSACKAALAGLTTSLASELASDGLRLNCVALGTVVHQGVDDLHRSETDHFERLAAAAPTGKLMSPRMAAEALLGVGLDQPALIGQIVVIDSGQMAQARL